MSMSGPLGGASSSVRLCLFLSLAVLAVPVFSVAMPPLLDYPNHWARLWLLSGGIDRPPISGMYELVWSNSWSNIGIDLLGVSVGRLVGAPVLGPVLLLASAILPPLGAAMQNRAAFGGWHWWQAGFAVLALTTTFLAGFLNFQISLGFALLAGALEPALARRPAVSAFAVRAVLAGLILVSHPIPLIAYAALIAGFAYGPRWIPDTISRRATGLVLAAVAVAVPVILIMVLAPHPPGTDNGTIGETDWSRALSPIKNRWDLVSAFRTYDLKVDLLVSALWSLPVLWALLARRIRFHAGLLIAGAVLASLSLLVPDTLGGAFWITPRFSIMGFLIMAAAVRPTFMTSRRGTVALAAALLALGVGRTAWVTRIWHQREGDIASVTRALRHVPSGAAVMPVVHELEDPHAAPLGRYFGGFLPAFWHDVTLVLPQRHAFVATLFAERGLQPVQPRQAWSDIAAGAVNVVSFNKILDPAWLVEKHVPYALHWRRFDYILLENADLPDKHGPDPSLPELQLVDDEGFARLYQVHHDVAQR